VPKIDNIPATTRSSVKPHLSNQPSFRCIWNTNIREAAPQPPLAACPPSPTSGQIPCGMARPCLSSSKAIRPSRLYRVKAKMAD
jgi:hypothetical protein